MNRLSLLMATACFFTISAAPITTGLFTCSTAGSTFEMHGPPLDIWIQAEPPCGITFPNDVSFSAGASAISGRGRAYFEGVTYTVDSFAPTKPEVGEPTAVSVAFDLFPDMTLTGSATVTKHGGQNNLFEPVFTLKYTGTYSVSRVTTTPFSATISVQLQPVVAQAEIPEPSSYVLISASLLALFGISRRQR